MIKGMMGPEHGAKAVFSSAKAAQVQRQKHGKLKITKLPTSVEELKELQASKKITDAADADG